MATTQFDTVFQARMFDLSLKIDRIFLFHNFTRMNEFTNFSDQKLLELCQQYGANALEWRRKFIGLLPEVNRRRLYEQKGFQSIFEFAAKLCGLSGDQVRLAINLEKRFENTPALKSLLINGEVSINKLARIASVATIENQETLANQVQLLPKSALETLIRDEKIAGTNQKNVEENIGIKRAETAEIQNGFQKPIFDQKSLPGQTLDFSFDDDVAQELNKLHAKGIDINALMRKMLQNRIQEIEQKKEEIATKISYEKHRTKTSRHIPVHIKKILTIEHGTKCSIPTCKKPAKTIHHTHRFALGRNHDPHFLAPLCKEHHVIAHNIDLKYQQHKTNGAGYGAGRMMS